MSKIASTRYTWTNLNIFQVKNPLLIPLPVFSISQRKREREREGEREEREKERNLPDFCELGMLQFFAWPGSSPGKSNGFRIEMMFTFHSKRCSLTSLLRDIK